MMRNLKIGMVLGAVLAMSAIGAGTALASGSLDVGASPAVITGIQGTQNKLTVTSASGASLTSVVCETSSIDATSSTASVTELTVQPTYASCTLGGLAASIAPGTCRYTLDSSSSTEPTTASVSVTSCTSTLTITQGTCVLSVASTSTKLEQVTFASVAGSSPKHVSVTLSVKKIPITGGTGCPANLQAAGLTGDLSGTLTVKAYSDSAGGEGTQVSLEATS